MIHVELKKKIVLWKEYLANFDYIIKNIISNSSIIIDFVNKLEFKDCERIIENIKNSDTDNLISEFKNNLSEIEELDSSNEILSESFKTLIANEFMNFDFTQFAFFQKTITDLITKLIEGLNKTPQVYDSQNKIYLQSFLVKYDSTINIIAQKSASFEIFIKLRNIQNNIVMIGANGSGKSTFSRNLKTIYSKQITVIPSQQLLYYKVSNYLQPNIDYINRILMYQKKDKLGNKDDIKTDTQDDFTNLILAIKKDEEDIARASYKSKKWEKESILEKIQKIWNTLINNKTIEFDNFNVNIRNQDGSLYSINSLSDGEKAIIYYAGHIFFAEQNAFIIIDEPENHMHTALCDKLWNALESERSDCIFIYLTHNLDFAVSRNNKTIIWNKSYTPPKHWDFEELPQDEAIPERLMIEIVGSRKNIIFCEGENKSSLDFKLYNTLFENYTIIPMRTRDDVIKSVTAYNTNPIFCYKAIGIVDKDNYSDSNALQKKNIFVIPVNEVENILCDEELLKKIIEYFCSTCTLTEFQKKFFKEI
ncbi:MAG TPA: AAA family ATPase [Eubacteriales bacterium]|nr:AAA family ATPase [Eubacteriales bacterium]